VTHDQTEALTFADKVVVMYEGAVVQIGTPEELFDRPAHTFVGYFIGSPGMNFVAASVRGDKAMLAGGHEVGLAGSYPDLSTRSGPIELGIRPEFIRIGSDAQGLPVKIRRIDDIGRMKVARVQFESVDLNVICPEDAHIDGDQARIILDPGHVHIYADGHLVERRPH